MTIGQYGTSYELRHRQKQNLYAQIYLLQNDIYEHSMFQQGWVVAK